MDCSGNYFTGIDDEQRGTALSSGDFLIYNLIILLPLPTSPSPPITTKLWIRIGSIMSIDNDYSIAVCLQQTHQLRTTPDRLLLVMTNTIYALRLNMIRDSPRPFSFCISLGEATSRSVPMSIGAPQGSVLVATLFRLYVLVLPKYLKAFSTHIFVDELAIQINGDLERPFSHNITEIEKRAKVALTGLEQFSEDALLQVNIRKTKALLVHTVVAPAYPKVMYRGKEIEFVTSFNYLGVPIATKLGWTPLITKKMRRIRICTQECVKSTRT